MCLPCEIGSFSRSGEDVCTKCPLGQTTLKEGVDNCIGMTIAPFGDLMLAYLP